MIIWINVRNPSSNIFRNRITRQKYKNKRKTY